MGYGWERERERRIADTGKGLIFLINKLDCAFFKYQVYGPMEVDKTSSSTVHQFTFANRYGMPAPVHLQLRQPQPQNNETSIPGIKLGYVLANCVMTWIKLHITFIWISTYTTQLLFPGHTEIDLLKLVTDYNCNNSIWIMDDLSMVISPTCHKVRSCSTSRCLLLQSLVH